MIPLFLDSWKPNVNEAPLCQDDVVGLIGSFVPYFDLRRSFIRVCKQWFAIGMVIAKGADFALTFVFF